MPARMVLNLGRTVEPPEGVGNAQAALQTVNHAKGSQRAAKVKGHWPSLKTS